MLKKHVFFIITFYNLLFAYAQNVYIPSAENIKAREEFQNDKLGMFIHWGVYSLMGGGGETKIGEWIMENKKIPVSAYEKLPLNFNPVQFNAKEWVAIAKQAGMKYITITTKHHDGFAMYNSKVSDYNIVKSTPYGRDILKELERECKEQGLKLFAYYSQLDWHHPDYYPRGWTGRNTERPEFGDWGKYINYQNAQIKELAENYDISGFWFDGWWDQASHKSAWKKRKDYRINHNEADWNLEETYRIIHSVKSNLLIGNNHHEAPFQGEDFQMFEKDLPGENTTGFGTSSDDIGQLPLETCETINGSWGFNLMDNNHKTVEELIKYVVNSAGRNTNFLLNVGPMSNGRIQNEHIESLRGLGQWMDKYGETIYGTRGGPITPSKEYVVTQKDNRLFFHILDKATKVITFQSQKKIKKIIQYDSKSHIKFKKKGKEVTFTVPSSNDVVTVLEVVLKNK